MDVVDRLSLGKLTALFTLAGVAVILGLHGQAMFSPGRLQAQNRHDTPRGGVLSHAELTSRCTACHAPPWSQDTMASRCLACHTDVRTQIDTRAPLHGLLAGAQDCRHCHTEHKGSHGVITDLARFDHDLTAYPLTGKHREVRCDSCHANSVYRGTTRTCAGCHAEPQVHKGAFGTDCAQCHSTSTWSGAVFAHSFPLNHGRGKHHTSACTTCHLETANYQTYTCYGCHRHDPGKTLTQHLKKGIRDVQACAVCHPTGRKRPDQPRRAAAPVPEILSASIDPCLFALLLDDRLAGPEPGSFSHSRCPAAE